PPQSIHFPYIRLNPSKDIGTYCHVMNLSSKESTVFSEFICKANNTCVSGQRVPLRVLGMHCQTSSIMNIQFLHYMRAMCGGSFEGNAQLIGDFFCHEAIRN